MWTQKHTGCGRKTERFERHFGNRLGRSERDVLERNVTRYCVATVRKQSAHNGPSQFGKKLQYAAVFNSLSYIAHTGIPKSIVDIFFNEIIYIDSYNQNFTRCLKNRFSCPF